MSAERCVVCGRLMHRYGFPGDGLAGDGRSHEPTAVACVNGLLAEVEELRKGRAADGILISMRNHLEERLDAALVERDNALALANAHDIDWRERERLIAERDRYKAALRARNAELSAENATLRTEVERLQRALENEKYGSDVAPESYAAIRAERDALRAHLRDVVIPEAGALMDPLYPQAVIERARTIRDSTRELVGDG